MRIIMAKTVSRITRSPGLFRFPADHGTYPKRPWICPSSPWITRFFLLWLLLFLSAVFGFPQESQDLISFLNETIVWYQQLTEQQQLVKEPSDLLFLNDNRQIAGQVSRLSFDFARARAQALGSSETGQEQQDQGGANLDRYKSLGEMAAKSDRRIKDTQQEIE